MRRRRHLLALAVGAVLAAATGQAAATTTGPPAAAAPSTSPAEIRIVKAESAAIVVGSELADGDLEQTPSTTSITLGAHLLFGKDSAVVTRKAAARLRTVAATIRQENPPRVVIAGHTDNLGSAAHGEDLSRRRAKAVRDALAPLLPDHIRYELHGYGERRPVADNSTEAGRQKNRRCTITIPRGDHS